MARRFKLKSTTFVTDPKIDWLRSGGPFVGEVNPRRTEVVRLIDPADPNNWYEVTMNEVDEVP